MGISGEGVDDLVRRLIRYMHKVIDYCRKEHKLYLILSIHRLFMAVVWHMNQNYTKYADRINAMTGGVADAKTLVTQYLGLDSAIAFESNGVIEQYAALLRADGAQGTGCY